MSDLFRPHVSTVKGLSERRRLPRLGKIRLGVKVPLAGRDPKKCECGGTGCFRCTRPTETDYFVCPPEVRAVYGDRPKKLDVMFLVNDPAAVFPQARKYYGSSRGLKCTGDGEKAYYAEESGELKARQCPCPLAEDREENGKVIKAQCSIRASLMVSLPSVNLGGIYQIDVGSYNSIIDVNSGIDTCRAIIQQTLGIDRFAMIPLVLERVPTETHHNGKKQVHYTLRLTPNLTLEQIEEMRKKAIVTSPQYALPEPEDVRPDLDGPVADGQALPEQTGGVELGQTEEQRLAAEAAREIDAALGEKQPEAEAEATPLPVPTTPPAPAAKPTPEKMRQVIAMWFEVILRDLGVMTKEGREELRHLWVATFYEGRTGLHDMDLAQLTGLYNVVTGKHISAEAKSQDIKAWLEHQKSLVQAKA